MRTKVTVEKGDILWIDKRGVVRFLSQGMDDWGELFESVELTADEKRELGKKFKMRLIYLSVSGKGSDVGPVFKKLAGGEEFQCMVPRKILTLMLS